MTLLLGLIAAALAFQAFMLSALVWQISRLREDIEYTRVVIVPENTLAGAVAASAEASRKVSDTRHPEPAE